VESENHSLQSEISEDPVEDGSTISDNIVSKPRQVTLTNGVVSNTPTGAIAQDPTRKLGGSARNLQPGGLPSQDCYEVLESIWRNRETCTVVSNFKKYESMALEDLSVPVDSKTIGGLVFTAKFKHITIVQNKRVTVAVPNLVTKQKLSAAPAKSWASAISTDAIYVVTKIIASIQSQIYFATIAPSGRQLVLQEDHGDEVWFHLKVIAGEIPDGYILNGNFVALNDAQLTGAAGQQLGQGTTPVAYNAQADQWANNRQQFLNQASPAPGNPTNAINSWPTLQGINQ
jgi:hypothetical protein